MKKITVPVVMEPPPLLTHKQLRSQWALDCRGLSGRQGRKEVETGVASRAMGCIDVITSIKTRIN